jgi:transcriptional adapter 3
VDDVDVYSFGEGDESEDEGGNGSTSHHQHHHAHEVRHYGTPPTFWRNIEPFFELFTQADLDFVNPVLREQQDRHLFTIPPLGTHYTQLWAQGQDAELVIKHHAPLKNELRTTSANGNTFDSNNSEQNPTASEQTPEEPIRCESLTSRILAALVEENILKQSGGSSNNTSGGPINPTLTPTPTPTPTPITSSSSTAPTQKKSSLDGRQTSSPFEKLNLLHTSLHLNIHSTLHPNNQQSQKPTMTLTSSSEGVVPMEVASSPPPPEATTDPTTSTATVPIVSNPLNLAVPPHIPPVNNYSHQMMLQIEERLKLELRALGLLDDPLPTPPSIHTTPTPLASSTMSSQQHSDTHSTQFNSHEEDEIVRELKRLQQQLKTHLASTSKFYAQLYELMAPKIAEGEEIKRKTEEMLQLEQQCLSKLSSVCTHPTQHNTTILHLISSSSLITLFGRMSLCSFLFCVH